MVTESTSLSTLGQWHAAESQYLFWYAISIVVLLPGLLLAYNDICLRWELDAHSGFAQVSALSLSQNGISHFGIPSQHIRLNHVSTLMVGRHGDCGSGHSSNINKKHPKPFWNTFALFWPSFLPPFFLFSLSRSKHQGRQKQGSLVRKSGADLGVEKGHFLTSSLKKMALFDPQAQPPSFGCRGSEKGQERRNLPHCASHKIAKILLPI